MRQTEDSSPRLVTVLSSKLGSSAQGARASLAMGEVMRGQMDDCFYSKCSVVRRDGGRCRLGRR